MNDHADDLMIPRQSDRQSLAGDLTQLERACESGSFGTIRVIRSAHTRRTTGTRKCGCRYGDVEQSLQAAHLDRTGEHSNPGMTVARLRAAAELKVETVVVISVRGAILQNRSQYPVWG